MSSAKKLLSTAACSIGLAIAAALPASGFAAETRGIVYVMTNQASGNSVQVYERDPNGTLTYTATFPTGGSGTGTGGDPLGSQGALVLQSGFLFAVNAGSSDISVFQVTGDGLVLLDKAASGGRLPVSIAVKGQLLYVLNAGGTPNISGFVIDPETRHLFALPNSQRPLAGGAAANPAEVHFSNDGESLLVTEKGTQTIDSYRINFLGYAVGPTAISASAVTPFGFAATRRGYAVVSEAGSGAVSSYDIADDGTLTLVSGPLALGENAPCWLVVTGDGQFAFTANAGSGNISSLRIANDGSLTLVNPAAGSLAAPLDMALTADSQYLYVREGNGGVTGFRVQADGNLAYVTSVTGIPAGAQGIAAR